ncbi:MAG: phosphoribosylanthranilate isomerase [Acidobacteriia bacterium]|nr:phosphoribosylanthranilate isomerase [Terriglobia bacterium]
MSRVLVKVSGITEERDAIEAALLGVDALGFHFSGERGRCIDPEDARRIVERLPAFLAKVGVFADAPLIRVLEIARKVGLTALQLDGVETPAYCESLRPAAWYKTLRIGPAFTGDAFEGYACTTFLLDWSRAGGRPGDAGVPGWRHARAFSVHGRILLSGGLDPGNVEAAIVEARPYGVDATSGVEFVPGKTNLDRLEDFVAAVRRAERRFDEPG